MTDSAGLLVNRLRDVLPRRVIATLDDVAAQRAAVAIVVTAEPEAQLLLVKRRERAGDPWSGHAAFPGGFASPRDRDASATAERETEEETGLPLARVGERLGRLDDVYPRSIHLPKVIVTPCVFGVAEQLPVTASPEIERALWVPLSRLIDAANRHPFVLDLPTGQREFESIHVGSLVIWGLTERIIGQFVTLIKS